jgi:signal transduction histidine kinase/ActR/RegA family two-component response regulator
MKRETFSSIATVKHNLSRLPVRTVRSLGIAVGVATVVLTGLIWVGQGDRIDWRATIAFGSILALLVGSAALWWAARTSDLCKAFFADHPFARVWASIKDKRWTSVSHAQKDYLIAQLRRLQFLLLNVVNKLKTVRANPNTEAIRAPLATSEDVRSSERVRLESAIETGQRDSGHILKSVLNDMSEGVIILDAQAACSFSNSAAEAIFGKKLHGISIENWATEFGLRHADSAPYATEELPFVQALRGTVVKDAQMGIRAGSAQSLLLSVCATPLTDASGKVCGAVGILREANERNSVEEALNRAKEEAERANQAKSEFLSRMSHELRTPLNAILGFAQLLDMAPLPGQDHDSIQQILKAGQHLLELINEVLDVARIESGRLTLSLEQIVALEIVQETVALIESQAAKRNTQLYIEAGPSWRSPIRVDRQRFKQVLLNLLSNAVKYNRDGGSVHISTEVRDGHQRLSVTDTGEGIAKEQFSLLFNPFERLGAEHSGVEGTGIGLALSKRLTEAMSGKIGAVSESGKGSTFWIEFPLAEVSTRPDAGLLRLSRSVASEKQTVVLCIEDNDSNYRLIERTLAKRPEVKLISGKLGSSALPLAEKHLPDLVLLDMHLPDLLGDEVLGILKSHSTTADIPVVVISADATPGTIDRMLRAGASAYLTKPLDISNLLEVVDKAIAAVTPNNEPCFKS